MDIFNPTKFDIHEEFFIPDCGNILFVNDVKAREAMMNYYSGKIVYVTTEDVEFRAYDIPPLTNTSIFWC